MLHEYYVIYKVRYYLQLHITAVGLGMYHLWLRGNYCNYTSIWIQIFTAAGLGRKKTVKFYHINS
jgi:hypothetical protein